MTDKLDRAETSVKDALEDIKVMRENAVRPQDIWLLFVAKKEMQDALQAVED